MSRITPDHRPPDTMLRLDFLFLDETICAPCTRTGRALDQATKIVAAPLAALGTRLEITRIHVASRAAAVERRLEISPTLRLDGSDIDPYRTQWKCVTCGGPAGGATTVNCRTWHWRSETYAAAPVGLLIEAILRAALDGPRKPEMPKDTYALPGNLAAFFEARSSGRAACC
ncbi:MAG: DUF2703 domain-containing protein [Pseudomonadota bacterium]